MKKWVIAMLLAGLWLMPSAQASIGPEDFLRAEGNALVNQAGETVTLQGVNAGGWLVQESWMTLTNAPSQMEAFQVLDQRFGRETREALFAAYEDHYWTEQDFDNVQALGMNVIRLPFAWWNLLDDSGALREDAFHRLDWFVQACGERGLYVILDLHGAPGSQNGNDHSGDITGAGLWDSQECQARTVYLWEEVARHYRGNPVIAAYDLLNEPTGGAQNATLPPQWDFFHQLYQAIRAVDPDHVISMESCWDPENLPAPEKYGWENVLYQYHCYKWNADNDYPAQKLFTDVKLHKMRETDHGVPVLVGEFTLFRNADAWRYALNAYNQAGVSWTIWTYKVTGPSSWGLYNVYGQKADIYRDSAERIEEIWTGAGEMKRNDWLCQVVAEAIAGHPVELPPEECAGSGMPPVLLATFDGGETVTPSPNAEVAVDEGALRLTVASSGDPGETQNAFVVQLEESMDAASYSYMSFLVRDMQGSNTFRLTLRDDQGGQWSGWIDGHSIHETWTRIDAPLYAVTGVALDRLAEIQIGAWNKGEYFFDQITLCKSVLDELP